MIERIFCNRAIATALNVLGVVVTIYMVVYCPYFLLIGEVLAFLAIAASGLIFDDWRGCIKATLACLLGWLRMPIPQSSWPKEVLCFHEAANTTHRLLPVLICSLGTIHLTTKWIWE